MPKPEVKNLVPVFLWRPPCCPFPRHIRELDPEQSSLDSNWNSEGNLGSRSWLTPLHHNTNTIQSFFVLFCFVFFFAVLQRAFPFHILQISSFPNSSHARTDFLAWLGELQTHRWRNESDTVQFLKPWSMGRFSQQQVKQLQQEFLVYRLSVFNDVQKFSKLLKLTCEFRHGILGIHQGEGWMG